MTPAAGTKLVRESEIEAYLARAARKAGALCYKFVSPGRSGVPDRLLIKNGRTLFVEVKTEAGRLSALQNREIERIRAHGGKAVVVWSKSDVDALERGFLGDD